MAFVMMSVDLENFVGSCSGKFARIYDEGHRLVRLLVHSRKAQRQLSHASTDLEMYHFPRRCHVFQNLE